MPLMENGPLSVTRRRIGAHAQTGVDGKFPWMHASIPSLFSATKIGYLNMFSKATFVDKEGGMLIHLRRSLEEDDFYQQKTRSSYIQVEFIKRDPPTHRHFIGHTEEEDDKYIYFGRIHHFLVQQFAAQPQELAYVEWFKPPFFH